MKEILDKLKQPFDSNDIEWRISRSGKKQNGEVWATAVAYIEARAAQERLDQVVGAENWKIEYEFISVPDLAPGIIGKLSINGPNGWVTKSDGSDQSDTESFKGGLSGAFKRVCSVWGIGRYLYNLTESYVTICDKNTTGARYAKLSKDGQNEYYYWVPPKLPTWALPISAKEESHTAIASPQKEPDPKTEINYDIKFLAGKFTGKTILEVLNLDSCDDFKYAKYWHNASKDPKSKLPPPAAEYLKLCAFEGVDL